LTIFTTKQKRKTDLEMKSEENLLFDGSNVSEFIQSFEDATNATVTRLFIGKLLEKESNVRKKQIEESLDEWRCVEVLQSFANKRDSHHLKADDSYKEENRSWKSIKEYLMTTYRDQDLIETRDTVEKWVKSGKHDDVAIFTAEFNFKTSKVANGIDPATLVRFYLLGLRKERLLALQAKGFDETKLPIDQVTSLPTDLKKTQAVAKEMFSKLRHVNELFEDDTPSIVSVPKQVVTFPIQDSMDLMMEKFSKLALPVLLDAVKKSSGPGPNSRPVSPGLSKPEREWRCVICDKTNCNDKRKCVDYNYLLSNDLIKVNGEGHALWPDGEKIQLNKGRGGILKLVKDRLPKNEILNARHIEMVEGSIKVIEEFNEVHLTQVEIEELDGMFDLGKEEEAVSLFHSMVAEKRKAASEKEPKRFRPWEEKPKEDQLVEKSKFRYSMPGKDSDKIASDVADQILNMPLGNLKIGDMLAVAPQARKMLEEKIRPKRIITSSNEKKVLSVDVIKAVDTLKTVKVNGLLNGNRTTFYVDGGSEICVMPLETAEKYGIALKELEGALITAAKTRVNFCGAATVLIDIADVRVEVLVYVIPEANYEFLLGTPWKHAVQHTEVCRMDGSSEHTIQDPASGVVSRFTFNGGNKATKAYAFSLRVEFQCFGKYKSVATKKRPVLIDLEDLSVPFPRKNEVRTKRSFTEKERQERASKLLVGVPGFLNEEEETLARKMLAENIEAFGFDSSELGVVEEKYCPPIEIRTVPHVPWVEKPNSIPERIKNEALEIVKERLNQGIIERSHGPYSSRYWFVPKKDGTLRFIQDLQRLNAVTVKDSGIPPNVEEFSEQFAGYPIYSDMDLMQGYDQLSLAEKSRDMTAIRIPGIGLVRLCRLPQGWTNSVAVFQRVVENAYADFIPEVMANFVDDIIVKPRERKKDTSQVFSNVRKFVYEFILIMEAILEKTIEAGIVFSAAKCHLLVPRVEMVGRVIFEEGRLPGELKKKKGLEWGAFKNLTEVRGFLGCVGTFRKWIHQFSQIAEPLFQLTRKNARFMWTVECEEAMLELKKRLNSAPVLVPINYEIGLIVNVDSGPQGCGGYIGQELIIGRVVNEYASFTFSQTVRNYSQVKREMYGLLRLLKEFKYKIYGGKFTLEFDCLPLKGMINNPDVIDPTIMRWTAYIRLFDFEWRHVPGKSMKVSDYLSRKPLSKDNNESACEEDELGVENEIEKSVLSIVSVPVPIEIQLIVEFLTNFRVPESILPEERKPFLRKCSRYFLKDGKLWKRQKKRTTMPTRVLWGHEEILLVLKGLHEECGHRSVEGTFQRLKERYYWRGFYNDCKVYVESCKLCQMMSRKKYEEPLHPVVITTINRIWYVDVQKMPKNDDGFIGIIEAREGFSGWLEARMIKKMASEVWVKFLYEEVVCRYGAVGQFVTDNGELNSRLGLEFEQKYKIQLSFTTTYHPQSNGVVERGHAPINASIAKSCFGSVVDCFEGADLEKLKSRWPEYFYAAVWADRVTVKKTTGFAPYKLMFGQECILPIELASITWYIGEWRSRMSTKDLLAARTRQMARKTEDLEIAAEKLEKVKLASKLYFDKNRAFRPEPILVGD
jgi:hypothetical protein